MAANSLGTVFNVAIVIVLATAGTTLGTVLYLGDDCEAHGTTGLQYEVCGDTLKRPVCAGTPHVHAWEATEQGGVRRITTDVFGVQVPATRGHCHGVLIVDAEPPDGFPGEGEGPECPPNTVVGYVWFNNQFATGCGNICPFGTIYVDIDGEPLTLPCVAETPAAWS